MPDQELTELTVLYRLRSRPSIELFRLSNPVNATSAIIVDELLVSIHERGNAEAFYRGTTHAVAPGDVCTFSAGEEFVRLQHRMPRSKCSWLVVPREQVLKLSAELLSAEKPPTFSQCVHAAPRVRAHFFTLAACIMVEEPLLKQDEALLNFFMSLTADCASKTARPEPPMGNLMPRAVRIAREYLHGLPDKDVRLADIARAARVSPYHLSHAFGRTMGISVHAYHLLVRIRYARQLLSKGRSAAEAAADAGFADQSHFTRHFKRIVGVPPGLYARGLRPLRKTAFAHEGEDIVRAGEDR